METIYEEERTGSGISVKGKQQRIYRDYHMWGDSDVDVGRRVLERELQYLSKNLLLCTYVYIRCIDLDLNRPLKCRPNTTKKILPAFFVKSFIQSRVLIIFLSKIYIIVTRETGKFRRRHLASRSELKLRCAYFLIWESRIPYD